MILSLADILTTNNIDKLEAAPLRAKPAYNDAANFKDYLNKPEAIPGKFPHEVSQSQSSGVVQQNNNGNVNQPVAKQESPQKNPDSIITESSQQNTATTQKIDEISLRAALEELQVKDTEISPENIKFLEEILPKLAEVNVPISVSAEEVLSKILQEIENSSTGVEDILSKMNFAENTKNPDLTAEQMAQAALATQNNTTVDISKVAVTVIKVAKDEAGKPQVPAANMRMEQVESLSNPNKKRDNDNNGINAAQIVVQAPIIDNNKAEVLVRAAAPIQITPNLNESLAQRKKIADILALNSASNDSFNQQSSIATGNIIPGQMQAAAFDSSAIRQVVGQGVNNFTDQAGNLQISAKSANFGMSTENFVKFQHLMDISQDVTKATPSRNHGPNEIIAQIKFGMSGAGKDDRNISIQLHPKELGKVEINMHVGGDGKTHIMIMAEKTDTLNMLQKEAASLKDMLTDTLKTDAGNLNFSFHEQGDQGWRQQLAANNYSGGTSAMLPNETAANEYLAAQHYQYNMIVTEGLDIRV